MDEALDFLQSRPLIGFQMDGSHLNNVLQSLIRQQQQLFQGQGQVVQRLAQLDDDVKEIRDHQRALERVVEELGGTDKLSQVRARIEDLEQAMDRVVVELDEAKKLANAAGQDADQAGRLADQAVRGLSPLQEAVQGISRDVDAVARQSAQDKRDIARALEGLDQGRVEQERRMTDALRDLQQKADRLARESGVERLRQMLDELSDRTDENFKNVEESARAVDAELSRQTAALNTLHGEVVQFDEKSRSRLASLASETDEKYQYLASIIREYEKASQELEEHLALAGQALARRGQSSRLSPMKR